MDRRTFVAGVGASIALPACTTLPGRRRVLPGPSFASLLQHLKHDVGTYMLGRREETASGRSACGDDADFILSKIKLNVTATQQNSAGATAGLTVPINLVTITGGASRSRVLDNSISVNLTLYPFPKGPDQPLSEIPPQAPEFEGTPITNALLRLRNDVRQTANTPPCFNFGKPADEQKQDNLVKWAFTVTDRSGGGLKFALLFFSIGGETSATETFANTVEATFIGRGAALQHLQQ